ncbi:MAG: hypothetical protein ACTHK4_18200, partial [Mycobacteriales bacterium]
MFERPGAVLLTPPGWDEPGPQDLGDWEPIPAEVWAEVERSLPDWPDHGLSFGDEPVDEALRLPL